MSFFFFNDTATTEIYTLSLHDALPIYRGQEQQRARHRAGQLPLDRRHDRARFEQRGGEKDRKSTRLNSSHDQISYAVFCLKKKKKREAPTRSAANSPARDCRPMSRSDD